MVVHDDISQRSSFPPPAPERRLYVIGDVHGCAGRLERLLQKIDADIDMANMPLPHLVFVGDLVDRGDCAADVIAHVHQLCDLYPDTVACLMGNHERMMLDFLDDPGGRGPRWLRYGGLQTLASYKLRTPLEVDTRDVPRLIDAAAELTQAMGAARLQWLRALPLMWQSGNVWVVHAAAHPATPMPEQSTRHLLWGVPEFFDGMRKDGQWVVHGHTPVATPQVDGGRIAVDTGAVYGGQLSAVRIDPDGRVGFLQVM